MKDFYCLVFQNPKRTFSYDDLLGMRPWLPDDMPARGVHPELDGLTDVMVDQKCGDLTFFNKQSALIVLSEYEESRRRFGGHDLWLFTHDPAGLTEHAEKLADGKLVRASKSWHCVD